MEHKRRFNFEYFNLYKEALLQARLALAAPFRRSSSHGGAVLIVDTCLIGEFAASLPAVRDFLERHPGADVDLLVAPPLAPLARRVKGVRSVYTARSVYGRRSEGNTDGTIPQGPYGHVIALRMSPDAYRALKGVPAASVRTHFFTLLLYGAHLFFCLLRRQTPVQWMEMNFRMLGAEPRAVAFEDLFDADEGEQMRVRELLGSEEERASARTVLIHTGASWPMKHWRADNWVALLNMLHARGDLRFVFVGGREDEDDYEYIAPRLTFGARSLIGRADLFELVLAMRECAYFIGIDSGPANLARLCDLRSVVIYGPGPHMYLPYDDRDVALDRSRGRGLLQMFVARRSGFIDRITPEEVYEAFDTLDNSVK